MVRNDIMDEGLGAQRVLFLVVMLSVAFARLPFFDNGPDASPPTQTTCDAFAAYAGPRIVAVGDVHGDYNALREVLAAAGLVGDASESCEWTGEDATLIQIGDVADRGPDVARANECLRALQAAAPADGGRVVRLVGNHELIRAEGSFRDAHPREAARIASVRIWRSEVEAGAVQAGFAVGPFLFTHSGFRPSMLRRLQRRTPDELAAHVNDRLTRALQTCVETAGTASCSFRDDVFSAGPDRGGRGVGGTFWTDWGVSVNRAGDTSGSRRRRGGDADRPRVAATPRRRRGSSAAGYRPPRKSTCPTP